MALKLAQFIIRFRIFFLAAVLLVTGFFAWHASQVVVETESIDLFPTDHEFVGTFKDYKDIFGGSGSVVIMVEVEEGDVFNTKTLKKLHAITKHIELMDGVNNYQVLSLAQRKVRDIRVDEVEGFTSTPIMWPKVPETAKEFSTLVETLKANPRYDGKLVSLDKKATLIVAGFFEDKVDNEDLRRRMQALIDLYEDDNTSIKIIGRPMMLGTILHQYPQLVWLFLLTVIAMLVMLVGYFRDLRGVLVPVVTAAISACWGIGFLSLLDFNFDPLIIVVPFIISARALSHSVQLINRYLSEYDVSRSRKRAAEATFAGLLKPGMLAIITDAAGVLVVFLTPIPLMQKLAVMGGFWVISILFSDLLFNPIFLSFLPPPKHKDTGQGGWTERGLAAVGRAAAGGKVWLILGLSGVVFVVGFVFASKLVVGDVHPGTPMLWPDSQYNTSTNAIADRFANTEMFNVIVDGIEKDAIRHPSVLRNMEGLQRALEEIPEVSASMSIADLLPGIISAIHGGDPKWELIPQDRRESGFFLGMIFSSAEPGDLNEFITPDSSDANIRVFLRDHKGSTLEKVAAVARKYVEEHPFDKIMVGGSEEGSEDAAPSIEEEATGVKVKTGMHDAARFRLAGGFGGLLAAVNEVIVRTEFQVTGLAFLIVFLFCAVAYRSVVAGLLFLTPLFISNYLTYALMGALEIGLDVNSLPVVALGVGLGVDYGLYVVARIDEEFRKCGDWAYAIQQALVTAGKAVFFTAGTMIVGVIFWAWSFLRFQADMGLLLVFWMVMSMLGGLVLLPTLIWLVKPKFLSRNRQQTV